MRRARRPIVVAPAPARARAAARAAARAEGGETEKDEDIDVSEFMAASKQDDVELFSDAAADARVVGDDPADDALVMRIHAVSESMYVLECPQLQMAVCMRCRSVPDAPVTDARMCDPFRERLDFISHALCYPLSLRAIDMKKTVIFVEPNSDYTDFLARKLRAIFRPYPHISFLFE
jgi:hypothetical protein